jgi:hypothetical protein
MTEENESEVQKRNFPLPNFNDRETEKNTQVTAGTSRRSMAARPYWHNEHTLQHLI